MKNPNPPAARPSRNITWKGVPGTAACKHGYEETAPKDGPLRRCVKCGRLEVR